MGWCASIIPAGDLLVAFVVMGSRCVIPTDWPEFSRFTFSCGSGLAKPFRPSLLSMSQLNITSRIGYKEDFVSPIKRQDFRRYAIICSPLLKLLSEFVEGDFQRIELALQCRHGRIQILDTRVATA